ncbi:MAG: GGDEF domain-containing protein [Actinomycetota bacterium]
MSVSPKIRTIADELVPLAQRMRYMRLFRVAICFTVVAFAGYAPDVVHATPLQLGKGVGAYLLLSFAVEGAWRLLGRRGLYLFGAMLIVDGVFLAWMAYLTGGASSALLNLILLHLVAVTLLASYRTGLKLAMWHSLLLLVVFYAQEAHMAVPGIPDPPALAANAFHRLVGFIAVYWVVALATATFSALNERELRRRRYDLEALAKMASSLETVSEARDVAGTLLENLMDTFGFGRGLVLAKLGNDVSVLAAQGDGVLKQASLLTADAVVLQAWQSRRTLLVSALDPEANPTLANILPEGRNVVVVPLTAEGGSVGAVVLEHGAGLGGRIERRVVSTVERFCSHAALALRNASLVDQLRDMAATDGLTGVANRRTFEAALQVELDRAARSGNALSLVLVDIDKFKNLNDAHGHQAGDEVLRQVAAALKQQSRGFDTPARYGGEEFAVILPGCDLADAERSAERFRLAIGQIDAVAPVTASAGVATFPVHAADAAHLVQMADAALYESKEAGRDRTTVAHPTLAEGADQLLSGLEPTASPSVDGLGDEGMRRLGQGEATDSGQAGTSEAQGNGIDQPGPGRTRSDDPEQPPSGEAEGNDRGELGPGEASSTDTGTGGRGRRGTDGGWE